MMLRATTTSGANTPLPAFTLPIIRVGDRSGRALRGRACMASITGWEWWWSSPEPDTELDHVGRA
jgi:hypothetical protein